MSLWATPYIKYFHYFNGHLGPRHTSAGPVRALLLNVRVYPETLKRWRNNVSIRMTERNQLFPNDCLALNHFLKYCSYMVFLSVVL